MLFYHGLIGSFLVNWLLGIMLSVLKVKLWLHTCMGGALSLRCFISVWCDSAMCLISSQTLSDWRLDLEHQETEEMESRHAERKR